MASCFVLDSNCIIETEERRQHAEYLDELKRFWQEGDIELAVVAVSASENRRTGQAMSSYTEFEDKLRKVGLLEARELKPPMIFDFAYWDHCILSSDEIVEQIEIIEKIMFPGFSHQPPEEPLKNSKWRRQMCDVLVAWSHRFHKSDYLVTMDDDFHSKKHELAELGVNNIVYPEEAVKVARGLKIEG